MKTNTKEWIVLVIVTLATLACLAVLLVVATGCTDDDEPVYPSCASLGAPEFLFCNRKGLCSFEGKICTTHAPGDAGTN